MPSCSPVHGAASPEAYTTNNSNEQSTRTENVQEVCYETPTCKFDYCVKRPDYVAMQVNSDTSKNSVHAGGRYNCALI